MSVESLLSALIVFEKLGLCGVMIMSVSILDGKSTDDVTVMTEACGLCFDKGF